MSAVPLLADAQRRLRPVGRPRKETPAEPGPPPIPPRLLDRPQSARYLNVSIWSLIDLEAAGLLARVRLGHLRRVLYDLKDLDRLIEAAK